MKKIITLLVAVVTLTAAQAQTSKEEARKVVLGDRRDSGNESTRGRDVVLGGGNRDNKRTYPNGYPESTSENSINREYDNKIASIRNNPYLSGEEKERMIRQLEKDRAKRLKEVRKGSKDRYDNDDDDDHKSNNGKHKGWTKGKGNQKKNKH